MSLRALMVGAEIVGTIDVCDIFGDSSGIALYQFNGDATDESGNYNGTATSVTYGEGKFGQCGVFNGTSSYVSHSSLFNIITRNTYSISVWHFIPNGTTGQRTIIHAQDNNNTHYPLCGIMYGVTSGKYSFALRTNSVSLLDNQGVSFTSGQWAHVVLMCTTGGAKAYLNGVEVASSSFTPVFTTNSTGSFNIGRVSQDWVPWIGHYCDGSIDQVRIFNRALTQQEITTLYTEGA